MAGSTVPAAQKNLATLLRARAGLVGVGVHTVDGTWPEDEIIVLTRVVAPQSFAYKGDPGIDEDAILSGYLSATKPGNDDTTADAAHDRAGVLLGELMQQLRDAPTLSGAISAPASPLLSGVTWTSWMGEEEGASVVRVLVEFTIAWTVGVT